MRMTSGVLAALAVTALAGCGDDDVRPPVTVATGPVVPGTSPTATAPPPSGASPTTSPRPAKTSVRPTPKTSAPAGAKVTDVSLTLNPTGVGPFCRPDSIDVSFTWSVRVASPDDTLVRVELHSSDGLAATDKRTAENGAASGSGRYALRWEDGKGRRIVDFWLQTVAPSRAESRHASFTLRCGPA